MYSSICIIAATLAIGTLLTPKLPELIFWRTWATGIALGLILGASLIHYFGG